MRLVAKSFLCYYAVVKFVNPHAHGVRRGLRHFILWRMGYYEEAQPGQRVPNGFQFPNLLEKIDVTLPQITWVNHSTFWVTCEGISILMDPIWNSRCSPVKFMGPERRITPLPPLNEIGKVDFVIISHNHYDHMDKATIVMLDKLYPTIRWIVPRGLKKWLKRWLQSQHIFELQWWDKIDFHNLTFTAVPAQHFSGRGIFDHDRTLWMGCVGEFKNGRRFYFAGDTGYNSVDFKKIGQTFRSMDLSLLPIGVYSPRGFMQPIHVNPAESILIHQEVGSKLSVAGHWGTFKLSAEELNQPPYDLFLALQKAGISAEEFRVLNPGQTINW